MASETTHRRDHGTGNMRQLVSPERLREILDEDGETYDPPSGFGPDDEWDVAVCADVDDVVKALANIADVKIDSDDRLHITDYAPDCREPEYGGSTEPGSAWDEECDRLLAEIREELPAGWSAEWSDDDVVISRLEGA